MKFLLSISLIFAYHIACSQQWEWARQATPNGNFLPEHINIDTVGNVYIGGRYNGDLDFGSGVTLSESLTGSVRFIAKYNSDGKILWAENIGQFGFGGMVLDDSANIYITGSFGPSSLTIGSTTLNTTSGWDTDVFVAKFDSGGTPKWAKKLTGGGYDSKGGIAIDKNANIYITGSYQSILTFGNISLNAGTANNDGFLIKMDRNGDDIWGRQVRQTSDSYYGKSIVDVAVSDSGNVYVTGGFESQAFSGEHLLISAGNSDIFTAKYDSLGNLLWTRRLGGGGSMAVLLLQQTEKETHTSIMCLIIIVHGNGRDIIQTET